MRGAIEYGAHPVGSVLAVSEFQQWGGGGKGGGRPAPWVPSNLRSPAAPAPPVFLQADAQKWSFRVGWVQKMRAGATIRSAAE